MSVISKMVTKQQRLKEWNIEHDVGPISRNNIIAIEETMNFCRALSGTQLRQSIDVQYLKMGEHHIKT